MAKPAHTHLSLMMFSNFSCPIYFHGSSMVTWSFQKILTNYHLWCEAL